MKAKIIIPCIIWPIIGVIGIYMFSLRGVDNTGLTVLGVIFALACVAHIIKQVRTPSHFAGSMGLPDSDNRMTQYDYIRLLATVFVIITHMIGADDDLMRYADSHHLRYALIEFFTLVCNNLFIMISGALLIPWREEKFSKFYLRRVSTVVFPMVIYYFWYQAHEFANYEGSIWEPIKKFALDLFTGKTDASPHYWLIYMILAVYIVIPLLRYMVRNMSYKVLTSVVVVAMVFLAIRFFVPVTFGVNTWIANWTGVAIMGYWVTRQETRKYFNLLMILGALATVALVLIVRFASESEAIRIIGNSSPILDFIGMGIFAFIFKFKIFAKRNPGISFLAGNSFGILLVHWWVFNYITFFHYDIHTDLYNGFGILIAMAITFVISLGISLVIENMLVFPFQFLFDMITGGRSKK